MDKEVFANNIVRYCKAKKINPSDLGKEVGLSSTFVSDIKRGRMPRINSVAQVADYLEVSISQLVGDPRVAPPGSVIAELYAELNEEGQEKALEFVEFLVDSKKYEKYDQRSLDAEEA